MNRHERALANVLALVAVNRRGTNADAIQVLHDLVGTVLRASEYDRSREGRVLQVVREQLRLVPLIDEVDRLLDQLDRRAATAATWMFMGSLSHSLASLRISGGIVAENISVCRVLWHRGDDLAAAER